VEIMFAREDGIPIDRAALEERIERGVDEAVARQVQPASTSSTTASGRS